MKVVFVVSRFPFPLEKGDKLRAFQHIRNMQESGHEVHLMALSDEKIPMEYIEKLKPFCQSVNILRIGKLHLLWNLLRGYFLGQAFQVAYFYSKKHEKQVQDMVETVKPDIIYCQLIRTALLVKKITSIPKAIDYQDAFSKGMYQRMLISTFWMKPVFKREHRLVKKFEKEVYAWFRVHFIISEQDLKSMEFSARQPVTILPNGIDTDYFKPLPKAKEFDITFTGNMNYPPNVDAAKFLVHEIMPWVWKKFPDAKVQLAGANPDSTVKSLASSKVIVTGWVNDIRDCYNNSLVFVAPMRTGTGLQNKLLEAMAMRLPCVTTPISFEPLGTGNETDILVGTSATQIAEHIIALLANSSQRETIAANGFRFVTEKFSLQHSRHLLDQKLKSIL